MSNRPPSRKLESKRDRPAETIRHYDGSWEKFSKRYRAEHPLCVDCEKAGMVTAAKEVHHIAKVNDNPERKYDSDNLMSLCSSCHAKRTAKGE